MDFQTVQKFTSNALAIQDAARMRQYSSFLIQSLTDQSAWHDTSLTIAGPSVVDLIQHFCERWNFVKKIKWVWTTVQRANGAGTSTITEWNGSLCQSVSREAGFC